MTRTSRHMSYEEAGVDTKEGARAVDAIKEMVTATARPEVLSELGGFGSCFSAAAFKDMDDPVMVSGTDGVGTKLALAQSLDKNDTVGQDLVAMCVDDIVAVGAEPLFFLDYVAIGKLKAETIAPIVKGIADGCVLAGCALVGGEMAEHPGVMAEHDYDLAGFAVGVVDRKKMLGPERVQEGDAIVGLPSSGIHSNGYSLVRKALTDSLSKEELLKPCEELENISIGEALLVPTRIYAGKLVQALRAGAPIHSMAHITGGGITENLNRAIPSHLDAVVDWGVARCDRADGFGTGPAWEVPPIIDYVIAAAQLTPEEAYRTFNMGVGMALTCAQDNLDELCELLESLELTPFVMGEVVAGTGQVIYH